MYLKSLNWKLDSIALTIDASNCGKHLIATCSYMTLFTNSLFSLASLGQKFVTNLLGLSTINTQKATQKKWNEFFWTHFRNFKYPYYGIVLRVHLLWATFSCKGRYMLNALQVFTLYFLFCVIHDKPDCVSFFFVYWKSHGFAWVTKTIWS